MVPDTREDYGEERWNAIGRIKGKTAVASFTFLGPEWIRVISLRRASRRERNDYEAGVED